MQNFEIQNFDNILGIIEYDLLEGTYQDHWDLLLALRITSQESHHICSLYSNITPNLQLHTGIPVWRAQPELRIDIITSLFRDK